MFRQPLQNSWLNKLHLLPKTTIYTNSYDAVKLSALARLVLDLEQPPFFFRFSNGSARARALSGKAARREKQGRVVICVCQAFCSTDQEKRETARSLG